jgi:hypothetical protein
LESIKAIYHSNPHDSSYITSFSIYDFLARRALDYYESTSLEREAHDLISQDSTLLSTSDEFIKIDWRNKARLKEVEIWLEVLKSSIEINKRAKNEKAYQYFNLRRLKGLRELSTLLSGDSLYRKTLRSELKQLSDPTLRDEIRLELAFHSKLNQKPKEAIEICAQCEDSSSFGYKECEILKGEILRPRHSMDAELVYSPERPLLFSYHYKNLEKVHFRIVKLKEEDIWNPYYSKERIEDLLHQKADREWSQKLRNWSDHKDHRTELMSSALKCGDYVLIASNSESFEMQEAYLAFLHFKVSNIAYLERTEEDGSKVLLFKDRITGHPLSNTKLSLFAQEYDQQKRKNQLKLVNELEADKNGRLILRTQNRWSNLRMRISHKDQFLISGERIYLFDRNLDKQERKSTVFFTDRNIYRP